jgi:hypothetical protein
MVLSYANSNQARALKPNPVSEKKLSYSPPKLESHGRIASRTAGGSGMEMEMGMMGMGKMQLMRMA